MKKRYLLCFSVVLLLLFLGFMIGCGGDGTGGINYQNLTVVPGILTPTPAGAAYGTVSGKVIDPLNNPLSNATVKVDGLSLTAVTNDKGEYTLWNVPGGKQKFVASKDGFIEAYNHGDVMPGQTSAVDILLPPNSWKDPAVVQQVKDFGKQVNEYLKQQQVILRNDHQAREATIVWLKQQTTIQDASFTSDGITIWYKTMLGMEIYIPPTPVISEIRSRQQKTFTNVSLSYLPSTISQNKLITSSEKVGKALILVPCRYEGIYWDNTSLKEILENWGYDVTYLENKDKNNPQITKKTWETILDDGYDLIVISTHGHLGTYERVMLSTGLNWSGWGEYSTSDWTVETEGDNMFDLTVAITPDFIYSNYPAGAFTNTKVVFCGACLGLANETMSNAFLSKGAKIYYGWTHESAIVYSIKTSMDLIGSMLSGDNAYEAYDHIKNGIYPGYDGTIDPFFPNAQLKYDDNNISDSSLKLRDYKPSTVVSTNYEDYHCEWVSQSDYPTTNMQGYLWVNFKNTGKSTWFRNGDYPVRLGTSDPIDRNSSIENKWLNYNRPCSLLQKYVNPNDIGTFSFFFYPPDFNPNLTLKEYFRPVVDNVTWMDNCGLFWIISNTLEGEKGYLYYTGFIPPSGIIEGNHPIGDGNVDVTVDKKGGK